MNTYRTTGCTLLRRTATLLGTLALLSAQMAHASVVFTNDSGFGNSAGGHSYLQQPDSNPNNLYFITQNWDPGARAGVSDPHPTGMVFDPGVGNWAIFNEDLAHMPLSAAFNVYGRTPGDNVYVHTATAANSSYNWTDIDNIYTNGNPNAMVWVTPVLNPGGGVNGLFDAHNIGVWYDFHTQKWSIYHQDGAPMQPGEAFNVLIEYGQYAPHYFVVQAGNTSVSTLTINNVIGYAPTAKILVTPVYNPGNTGGVYNDHPIGVLYRRDGNWAIFNEDMTNIPAGAAFNVWILGY